LGLAKGTAHIITFQNRRPNTLLVFIKSEENFSNAKLYDFPEDFFF
jgi:hypothetical protein